MANKCADEATNVPKGETFGNSGVGVYRTRIPGSGEGDYVVGIQLPGSHHAVVVVGNVVEIQQPLDHPVTGASRRVRPKSSNIAMSSSKLGLGVVSS